MMTVMTIVIRTSVLKGIHPLEETIPVMSEEYEISLVMESNDPSAFEFWIMWEQGSQETPYRVS